MNDLTIKVFLTSALVSLVTLAVIEFRCDYSGVSDLEKTISISILLTAIIACIASALITIWI